MKTHPTPDQIIRTARIHAVTNNGDSAVVITTAAAILYVATADKVYEATTQIQVVPVDDPEGRLSSLGLINQSSDPLRAVETAVTLIESRNAAQRVADGDNQDRTADAILRDVSAEPIAAC